MARGKSTGTKNGAGKRTTKSKTPAKPRKRAAKGGVAAAGLDEDVVEDDEDLPKDEAGRLKIKRQYEELLGIRVEKLKGRVLNRERINKTIEGVYFICATCKRICHNLDEGMVEDPENEKNLCHACGNVKDPRGTKGRRKKSDAAA